MQTLSWFLPPIQVRIGTEPTESNIMNSLKTSTFKPGPVIGLIFLAGLSMASSSWAAVSSSETYANCRNEAEVRFGSAEQPAEVRLDGFRKSGKEVRLKVFTPEGEQINALCTVNRKTGEVLAIEPPLEIAAPDLSPASD